jgi:uncharacterized protein with PQ loop repeat
VDVHTLALTIAYLASAVGVAAVVPQITRTLRHPHMAGVAPLSYAVSILACTGFMIYGLRADVIPQIPGNVLLVSGSVAIVLLVPSHLSVPRRAALLALAVTVVAVAAFSVPVQAAGFLAFGISLFSAWPQVLTTLRGTREAAGVSLTTFGLRLGAGLGWLVYALLTVDVPVIFSASVMVGTTVLVLAVESSRRAVPVLEELAVLEPA